MFNLNISESILYRWRYWIGYGLIAIGLITVLVFAGLYLPGGISETEMNSVVKSNSISLSDINSLMITNLPYHLLQKASLSLFGLSIFSIKLPSIILAFFSALGMVILLSRWFKPNVGVLASLIAITTGQFIYIAQEGTPHILYLFWSIWLILLASLTLYEKKRRMLYKISFFIVAALSLYTPLSIYVIIALASAILLHPHLRYFIKQSSRINLLIGFISAIILSVPIAISVINTPNLGLELLGIPTKLPDFGTNFASLGAQFFGFSRPSGSTIMTPFFELGSMLIIALGIYNIFQTRATAKSYVIGLWILFLMPIIILNPDYSSISFLPLVLLLSSGLRILISHWYDLFPRNPYARIGGLIPIVILVSVLVLSGLDRYVYGYRYDPNIASNFSKDINLIPKDIKNIVVTDKEFSFYNVFAVHNKDFIISKSPISNTFIATKRAKKQYVDYEINKIITTSNSTQSDRFYVYKKIIK